MEATLPNQERGHPIPILGPEPQLPKLSELGLDLLRITPAQRVVTLAVPFLCVVLYFLTLQP
jgi:hypothetical protein